MGLWFMVYMFMSYGFMVYGLWVYGLWVIQKLRAFKNPNNH